MNDIRSIKIDDTFLHGSFKKIKIVFGRHHYLELTMDENDKGVDFEIGSTHHGVKFDASKVSGELDKVIDLLRTKFKDNNTD